jgi:hypothetical protein
VNKVFGAVDEIPIGSFAWVAKRREDFWKFSVWEGK